MVWYTSFVMGSDILILVILILLSAFFSGSETALVSVSPAQVRALQNKKNIAAGYIAKLKKNPHRLLIIVLVGNNLVNISASGYAALFFTDLFGSSGIGIATGVMTFLLLVFGEVVPKSFATKHSVGLALVIGPIIYYLGFVLFPIIWFFEKFTGFFVKHDARAVLVTEEELKAMVHLTAEGGGLEASERELIENVLQFNDIQVKEIMTPRVDVDALESDTAIRDAAQFIIEHAHTRIPVYRDRIDNVIGILSVKDILGQIHDAEDLDRKVSTLPLLSPLKTPQTKRIHRLFQEFQKARMHMALVYDEHGGFSGIVTLEDILEEIVGEIIDEHDEEDELVQKVDENEILVKGKTHVEIVRHALKVELPENWEDSHSISGVILEHLKRFPKQGEIIDFGFIKVTVEKMTQHRILVVRVRKVEK